MAYDLQNHTITFQAIPPKVRVSATVTDSQTGAVRGTVTVTFPDDLGLLSAQDQQEVLRMVVRELLRRRVQALGLSG